MASDHTTDDDHESTAEPDETAAPSRDLSRLRRSIRGTINTRDEGDGVERALVEDMLEIVSGYDPDEVRDEIDAMIADGSLYPVRGDPAEDGPEFVFLRASRPGGVDDVAGPARDGGVLNRLRRMEREERYNVARVISTVHSLEPPAVGPDEEPGAPRETVESEHDRDVVATAIANGDVYERGGRLFVTRRAEDVPAVDDGDAQAD